MANYGSVCSGIEAASVAWHSLGWRAAWLAEIEPFPAAVLVHHYPDVPNYGDMTALAARVRELEIEAPDVLVGGTPCQAFSVAGLRQSLHDDRGQLTLKFLELADAIDTVRRTREEPECIIVWENVPGVLNTKDNAFGCFLAGLAGESEPLLPAGGRWTDAGCVYGPTRTVAWRVLDAQYFGLAQRRRRVFVVASARNDFDPAAVLFEFDGVRRDTAPSRETRQGVARGVTRCFAGSGESGVAATQDRWLAAPVPVGTDCYNGAITGDVAATIGTPGSSVNASGPTVMQPIAFSRNDFGGDSQNNLSPTMRVAGNAGGMLAVAVTAAVPVAFAENSRAEIRLEGGDGSRTGALTSGGGKAGQGVPCVAVAFQPVADCLTAAYATKWNGNASATNGSLFAGQANGDGQIVGAHALGCGSSGGQASVGGAYGFQPRIGRNGRGDMGEVVSALTAHSGETGKGDAAPCVAYPLDLRNALRDPDKHDEQNRQGCGVGDDGEPAPTLTKAHVHGVACVDVAGTMKACAGTAGGQMAVAFSAKDYGADATTELSPTLRAGNANAGNQNSGNWMAVAFEPGSIARNAGPSGESVLSPTLRSQMGDNQPAVRIDMQVRRLTPVECERLQGFPDNYTAIPWRKKPASECPDGPRYKALGNSMAVPVMRWIGERIDNHLNWRSCTS